VDLDTKSATAGIGRLECFPSTCFAQAIKIYGVVRRRIFLGKNTGDKLGNLPADKPALACHKDVFGRDSAPADSAASIHYQGAAPAAVNQVRGDSISGVFQVTWMLYGCIMRRHHLYPLFD
jgi:hypothetical protein